MQDTGINSVWKSWYKGDVAGFHQYKYYNGEPFRHEAQIAQYGKASLRDMGIIII